MKHSIHLAGCDFPAAFGTQGVVLRGAPGAGKTQLKNQMLARIYQGMGEPDSPFKRAILWDEKNEALRFLARLGIPSEHIIIFDPSRIDTAVPNFADMFAGEAGSYDFGRTLFPPEGVEPYFRDMSAGGSASVLDVFQHHAQDGKWYFEDALIPLMDEDLLALVLRRDKKRNATLIKNLLETGRDTKPRSGVLTTIDSLARKYRVTVSQFQHARLRGNPLVSLDTDWMARPGTIVVIRNPPSYSKSWPAIAGLLFAAAIRAFKDRTTHTDANPNLTLFDMDEFPQIHVPKDIAQNFFATARGLGASPIVGLQNDSLLYDHYGRDAALAMLGNLSLEATGYVNDQATAMSASERFGHREVRRKNKQRDADGEDRGDIEHVEKEPRLSPGEFLEENKPGNLRFYCKAPGMRWRYDLAISDVAKAFPAPTPEELEREREMRAPQQDLLPWTNEDLVRLGLKKAADENQFDTDFFVDPDAEWTA